MSRTLISLFILLAATTAFAQQVDVDPPAPTSNSPITLYVTSAACGAPLPSVTRTGQTVRVDIDVTEGICIATPVPFTYPVRIGTLPAGTYDVFVAFEGHVVRTLRLDVAEANALFRVWPAAGQTNENTPLLIAGDFPFCVSVCSNVLVTIGDVTQPATVSSSERLRVTAPPHAAGWQDVTISVPGENRTFRSENAFLYYVPSETPDPVVFEWVLFPVAYTGPGGFGAMWSTEAFAYNGNPHSLRPQAGLTYANCPPNVSPCSGLLQPLETAPIVLPADRPNGYVAFIAREAANDLDINARIRDTSRSALTWGTEIPVVRERDFRDKPFSLLDVPVSSPFRQTLRVYSTNTSKKFTLVNIYASGATEPIVRANIPLTPIDDALASGSIADISTVYPQVRDKGPLRVEVVTFAPERMWAFVSITNNDTQQVTLVTPK
jgi:hypothetical protein